MATKNNSGLPEVVILPAELVEESKPFYKRRRFWMLLLLGGLLGGGLLVAIPFMAPSLVMGTVILLTTAVGVSGGWALIGIAGVLLGLALAGLTYAVVQKISSSRQLTKAAKLVETAAVLIPEPITTPLTKQAYDEDRVERPEVAIERKVEGSHGANELAKKIAACMAKEEDSPENREEESRLRKEAIEAVCISPAEKAAYYFAALGVECPIGTKDFNEGDYKKAYRQACLRWNTDRHPELASAPEEIRRITGINAELTNSQSKLWKGEMPEFEASLKARVNEIQKDTAELRVQTNEMRAGVSALHKILDGVEETVAEVRKDIAEVQKDNAEIRRRVLIVHEKADAGIAAAMALARNLEADDFGGESGASTSTIVRHSSSSSFIGKGKEKQPEPAPTNQATSAPILVPVPDDIEEVGIVIDNDRGLTPKSK